MRSAAVALAFLTRLRVPVEVRGDDQLAAAVPWFGPVGLLVGAVVGAVCAGLGVVLDPTLAGTVGVAVGLLLTGAFHEDGLADTFDGLAGGYDPPRRLAIMRDSRVGTFGAAALVLALVARAAAAGDLGAAALPWFVVGHGVSRVVATAVMVTSRPARADGLGARHLTGIAPAPTVLAGLAVAAVTVAVLPTDGVVVHAAVWGVAAAAAAAIRAWAYRAVDGVTGDVLGAVQVVALVGVLVVGTAATA